MAGKKEYQLAIKIAGEIEKSLGKSVNVTKSELRSISREATKATYGMNSAFSNSAKSVGSSLDRINAASNKMLKVVGKAAKLAGAGVAVGLGASIKAGADFEAQMSSVQAISGSTADEMKQLNKVALQYGSTTAFTAKEAGEALEYMALAGYDSEKSIAMLPNVLNLAAAGEMELGRASDQVTDAQSALGLSMEETTTLVDQMAQTASKSNTSVEQLGDAILQVGGTAKTLKGGTTELNAVLGLLADNGIKGSEGGTKLRNMILALIAPTDKAAAKIKELGLNVIDSKGNFRSLSDIMQELNEKTKGMGNADKSALLKTIFNKTDIKAINALLGTSKNRWNELSGEIDNASGAADKMAKTKLDNLKGDVTLFKSALEGTGVKIYNELQGPLRDIVQTGTEWVQDAGEWFVENFPAIKSAISDVGEAIGAFASPFLAVGKWLLDNPAVISGAIGGIGSAIITFKVASGIKSVVSAISGFASLNPVIAIIGGIAVGIGAIAAATAEAAREAKKDNLAKHFGDLAMSMDDLEDAAREIVGRGDLETVDELLSALGDSKNIENAMATANKAIKKYNWKIEAGLAISKEDTKDYANQVKSYVQSAQELIDQKGYEVNISTKLLFGDGKQAKALNAENNAFYTELDSQMQTLTKQLNKYLDDALENGLTPDTEAVINKTLEAMDEITQAISDAEAQANWDMMAGEWSGKALTAESFEELQNQINENLEKEYEGIDEATKSSLTAINAKYSMGKITQAEAEQQKADVTAAGEQKKKEATDRGVSFQFNTLMDTYGETIANGGLVDDQSARDAVHELTSKILESKGASTSSVASILRSLEHASAEESGALSWINPFSSDSKLITALAGTQSSYYEDQMKMTQFASQYIGGTQADHSKEMVDQYRNAGNQINSDMEQSFGGVESEAAMAGRAAGQDFFNNFKRETAQMSYYVKGLVKNPTSGGYIPGAPSNVPVPHAKGGIFNKPHVGMVGEAGTESVIPINDTKRSYDLYRQTGAMLGLADGGVTFAPTLTINAPGADKKGVKAAAKMSMDEFGKLYKQFAKDQRRRAL